jgi:hypothetical protein
LPPVICAIISARSLRGRRLRLISVTCERPIQGAANSGRKVTIALLVRGGASLASFPP